jgi:hypothetical protein
LFIGFIISKGIYVYDAFSSGDMMNFGKNVQSELLGSSGSATTSANNKQTVENRGARSSNLVKPYFYLFKNKDKFKQSQMIFASISPTVVLNESSIFCYCTVKEIEIIDNIVRLMDQSNNIKIDFILVSFNKKDYLDFSLKYSFKDDFFTISPSAKLIPNLLLLDYLKTDYQALTKINSSALVEVGHSFSANFVTKYPVILKDYKASMVSSSRSSNALSSKLPSNTNTKDASPTDRVVSESINFNDVGFKFRIDTEYVDDKTVSVALNQSHSFLQGFVGDVPIMDKRDFKSRFLLKDGQLVPLFNLSSLLNSKSSEETLPFLSLFLPDKVDDSNSSYQVFLRFRFEDVKQKVDIRKDTIQPKIKELENAEDLVDVDSLDIKDEDLANELLAN